MHGEFVNKTGQTVEVMIETSGDRTESIEIGTEASGVWFPADSPVVIDCDISDTFDVQICHSCTITLLSREWLPALFCANVLDGKVNVYVEGRCVFAGYIEPQTYSQDFVDSVDEIELSCIDALSALQYRRYKDVGQNGVYYRSVKKTADTRIFSHLLLEALQTVTVGLDLKSEQTVDPVVWYDKSRAVDAPSDSRWALSHLAVNDLLFLGDESDDVWGYDEVVEAVLKYMNLHIVQVGLAFCVFDWGSLRDGGSVEWVSIFSSGTAVEQTTTASDIVLTNAVAADTDTSLSIGETYNRLELTADVESIDTVVTSPLDSDSLTPAFSGKQPYLVEYSSGGEGDTAFDAFRDMIEGKSTDWECATKRTWYVQAKKNTLWTFRCGGAADIYSKYATANKNQQDLLNALRDAPGAAIVSLGKFENKMSEEDNSPTSKLEMTDYLFISVNGNGKDTEAEYYPNADSIKATIPIATYDGKTSGGVFSPVDDDTVNYILIDGKMILNPLMGRTENYSALYKAFTTNVVPPADEMDDPTRAPYVSPYLAYFHQTVDIETDTHGHTNRYYAQRWLKCDTPRASEQDDTTRNGPYRTDGAEYKNGLYPYTGEVKKGYQFRYSAVGESADTISKVPVLACMLIIGDKCVVEVGMDGGAKTYENATPWSFIWTDYKERSACKDDEEYYAQSFTIGIDPKKNDYLVGTEFDIQNNVSWEMGLEDEGTAIPIRRSDHVSGAVTFKILGIVNLTWDEITRKHPTFWRHTSWKTNSVPLMAHVSSVILKDFSMEVVSDNGLNQSETDNNYVYVSETDETFVNKKDDLEFKITSALTTAEALEMGVANTVAFSTPCNATTRDAITTIYDTRQRLTEKPEKLYVDAYWKEWHQPRVELEMNIQETAETGALVNLWRQRFVHPALGKTFYTEGVGWDLMEGSASVKMKEVF